MKITEKIRTENRSGGEKELPDDVDGKGKGADCPNGPEKSKHRKGVHGHGKEAASGPCGGRSVKHVTGKLPILPIGHAAHHAATKASSLHHKRPTPCKSHPADVALSRLLCKLSDKLLDDDGLREKFDDLLAAYDESLDKLGAAEKIDKKIYSRLRSNKKLRKLLLFSVCFSLCTIGSLPYVGEDNGLLGLFKLNGDGGLFGG